MKASLQQQPMYCSRDHNYPSRLNQQYEKSTQCLIRFTIVQNITKKETAVLAIPEMCMDKIITLYHKSLVAGHQGVIKTYLTISD